LSAFYFNEEINYTIEKYLILIKILKKVFKIKKYQFEYKKINDSVKSLFFFIK
jgi:hypothetical protein